MAIQEHLDILRKGVSEWNAWRATAFTVLPDLSEASFAHGWMAPNIHYIYSDLPNADLRDANLENVNLTNAELHGADLRGANLTDADLSGAKLVRAHLHGTIICNTRLEKTNFSDARLGGTIFVKADLRNTHELGSVTHEGPSSIGIDTIYRSQGKIPESFLRGAGVPENFITYMRSLAHVAFDFYSCFISYSSKDQAFADRLYADLQSTGVRCWFAPHDIQAGRKVHEQIDEKIRLYDKLLLILSDASMNSNWVKTEIAIARAREDQQKRQMLFPLTLVPFEQIKIWKLFDADSGIDSAREIREYFIPDFSNWKDHDAYATEFERLVKDLKAKSPQSVSA